WIAPMIKERFGSMEYTPEVKEWEYGRYKSLFGTIVNEKFLPNLLRMSLDIVTLGKIKFKGDKQILERQYRKFLEENPDMDMDINEYMELRERTLRETMHEMKIILGLIMVMMAAKGDWDDDGT